MISPRKPESARPVVVAKQPIPTAPRGHRHTIPTFSKPPSTSREFFAAYYCAEDDEQESYIRVPGSKGQALPPALQVSPNESLSSPGGRGQRPTPRKCRLLSGCPQTDDKTNNNSTVNSNSQQGLLRSTTSGESGATSTYRPNSAKWETDQGLVLKHELAQHVKYERAKETYVRAHSLHRKPQRRLISKPAPRPPVMGTTAFGTCYSKESGLSRNESSTMSGSPHEDTGESKHDMPDETVLGHVKFVTTSPRKAAKAPESRTVVMYGAASPINPSSLAPSSSTSTPRKPQTANNNISNTPKLPMLSMMHTQTATLPLSARSATAPGSNTNNNSMRLTSRQQRLVEANNKRKILKPPVTPDLPDALWEGDLTQLDTFEQVHHQLKNVTIANDDNRPLSRTAGGTLRSPTNANGGGQQTRPRLEASLGETMVPYGPNDSLDDEYPPARKRDYQLIKAVFRAMMLQDTYPCRMMRALGGAEVLRRHEDIVQRYGYKRLNRDDFHYQIVEILKIQQHTIDRKDTNMMFDAFDTALSGYVSEREFEQGIHWVMQGPDERRRIVASYCKHFLSARNVMEAVVSLLEIDMMLTAIVDTCEGRFPGVREDAAGIQARLEPLTRHGTVPFPLFYEAVSKSRLVGRVVRLMQPNGTLPQTFLQSADPDPNREVGTLTVAIDNLQFAEGTMFQATTASSTGGGVDPTGGRNPRGSNSQQQRGSTTGAVAPSGGDGGGGAKPAGGGLVDLTHPRFKADLSARPQEYRPTPEHEEVKWCLRNGIVWRE